MFDQLPLEGMPRRLYSCTPSRLNTWLDCRRRYRFTYLDRPQPPKGPRGDTTPWAPACTTRWRPGGVSRTRRTPLTAAILVTNGWITEGFRDPEQSAEWLGRARELVSGYVATLDPGDDPVGVERTVATRTKVIAVSGRIDRLDRRGDELVVVDYKTGRRPLTQDDARSSLALAIYAIAASRMMRTPCHAVELHHLPTGEIVEWRHTDESLGRHLSRAEEVAVEASDADEVYREAVARPGETAGSPIPQEVDQMFAPSPGPICSWCDFRRHCPEGQKAAPDREPWSALLDR